MRLSEKLAQIPLPPEPLAAPSGIPSPDLTPPPITEPTPVISGEIPPQPAEPAIRVTEAQDPERANRLQSGIGSAGVEFLYKPYNDAMLAINGLMQARALKGAAKETEKADSLKLAGSVRGEASLSAIQHRVPRPELTPVTRLENIHHKGAWAKRVQSIAVKHKRYTIGKAYSRTITLADGTKVTPIPGSKLYFDTLNSTRMLASDKKSAIKEGHKYNKAGKILTKGEAKLEWGVTGLDRAGRHTAKWQKYHTGRAQNATEFASDLAKSAAERRIKMDNHDMQIQAQMILEANERARRDAAARATASVVELFNQDDTDELS